MKVKFHIYILFVIIILLACERDKKTDIGEYLVSYEHLKSSSVEQNKSDLEFASKHYPEFDSIIPLSKYGTDIYKVEYKTELSGKKIVASGLVSIPQKDTLFPLISFHNGTNTCNKNAPSVNSNSYFFFLISMMAGNGYIIALPDYIGFGASENILHPYLHRKSTNNAIIDLIRATTELIVQQEIEARYNGDLYLMGYSQGGWATLSILDSLEKNPLQDIHIVAAAGGAGAYDLVGMTHYILSLEEYSSPYFLSYFIESRRQNGILSDTLTTFFKEPYALQIPELFDGYICDTEINSHFTTNINDFLSDDMLNSFDENKNLSNIRTELEKNSIKAWSLQTPLRLFHSIGDKTIPNSQSESLYEDFIVKYNTTNEKVSLQLLNDSLGHGDAIIPWGIDALLWFRKISN